MKQFPDPSNFPYSSITLDIFDTILMRKIWPEEVQFLEVARLWSPVFGAKIDRSITYYELYTYRRDVRRVLHAVKRHHVDESVSESLDTVIIGIEEWFERIIDALADRYDKELSTTEKRELLKAMIDIELAVEKSNLKLNTNLVRWLKKVKHAHPNIKIMFVSDMYLRAQDINELLKFFNCEGLIDSGVTSSDVKRGKWSGKLYSYLEEGGIHAKSNLHVGDNYQSDIVMAKSCGHEVLYYNPLRNRVFRPLMTRIYKQILKHHEDEYRTKISRQYNNAFHAGHNVNERSETAHCVGAIFASPLVSYLSEMIWFSAFGNAEMLAVSSEARTFRKFSSSLCPTLNMSAKITYYPEINRKKALLALLSAKFRESQNSNDELPVVRLLKNERGMTTYREMLAFIFGARDIKQPKSLDNMSEHRFNLWVKDQLADSEPHEMNASYQEFLKLSNKLRSKHVFILDVGWNGSVQAMMQQYFDVVGDQRIVNGIYLGFRDNSRRKLMLRGGAEGWLLKHIGIKPDSDYFVPDIWEFIYTQKSYGTDFQLLVHQGLVDGINYYKNYVHVSPMEFFFATKQSLHRLLVKPDFSEAKLLGSLKFNAGFQAPKNARLIDMTKNRKDIIFALLLHPRHFSEQICQSHTWIDGFMSYYRIGILGRPIIRALGSRGNR